MHTESIQNCKCFDSLFELLVFFYQCSVHDRILELCKKVRPCGNLWPGFITENESNTFSCRNPRKTFKVSLQSHLKSYFTELLDKYYNFIKTTALKFHKGNFDKHITLRADYRHELLW